MSIRDTGLVQLAIRRMQSTRALAEVVGIPYARLRRLVDGQHTVRGKVYLARMKPYERHVLRKVLK